MCGTGLGATRTVYMGPGATSPILFGPFADYGLFNEGFAILAVIAAAVCLLSLRVSAR